MTPNQKEEIRKLLHEQRDQVLQDLEAQRNADRDPSEDEMEDPADRAELELERAFEHRRENDDIHLLQKIQHAFLRLEEGTYEVCEGCQGIIRWERLRARPVVSLCHLCQQAKENGQTVEKPR